MSGVPPITVLMPVHNGGRFLREAVQSVLDQTHRDLELLVIEDGSTDASAAVLAGFSDPRIRMIRHAKNQGLIASLNEGLDQAKGRYVARMDADDVMHPERIARQFAFMERTPGVAVVACFVDLIDADGQPSGTWNTDRAAVSEAEIRRTMARTNCIAHPSVMIRMAALGPLRYAQDQRGAEDWDLWMRLLARGRRIAKLPEAMLQYRVHPGSIMGHEKQLTLEQRLLRTRRRFLRHEWAHLRFGLFQWSVLVAQFRTLVRHLLRNVFPNWTRGLFRLLTYSPFALLRERRAFREVLASWTGRHVFCFSYLNTGGAEQVHDDIMATVADQHPLILITGFSRDRAFAERFAQHGLLLEIPRLLHHPFTSASARRQLAERINAVERPVFFGANTDHFFGLLPLLKPATRAIFLQHAFLYQPDGNVKHKAWVKLVDRVERYVFVSEQARRDFASFLQANGIPRSEHADKLLFISNAVHAFGEVRTHPRTGVLFVGRASAEKRLELFLDIARMVNAESRAEPRFTVVGTDERTGPAYIDFSGVVKDPKAMAAVYAEHDVLVVTSLREGFPMVIMEAMANGLAILSTPVGDIPNRLGTDVAILSPSPDAKTTAKALTDALLALLDEPERLGAMKQAALTQAKAEFGMDRFRERYRTLLTRPTSEA